MFLVSSIAVKKDISEGGADASLIGNKEQIKKRCKLTPLFFVLYFWSVANPVKRIGKEARESDEKRVESLYYIDNKQVKLDSNSVFFDWIDRTYVRYSHALFSPALLTFRFFESGGIFHHFSEKLFLKNFFCSNFQVI